MSDAASLWQQFLDDARVQIAHVAAVAALTAPTPADLSAAAGALFTLRAGAALLGVDAIARTAGAAARALDDRGAMAFAELRAPLAECAHALDAAVGVLLNADRSGARLDDTTALDAAAAMLATHAQPPAPPAPRPTPAPPPPSAVADDSLWVPQVDADMIEPFLEEAGERIDALSQKLLRLEAAPSDLELVREIFRDLHTIKGSSAFVGLKRMNQLAHAAEDLVGQLRDGQRAVDRAIVDALLGALDGLRAILQAATQVDPTAGARVDVPIDAQVARLRAPHAPPPGDTTITNSDTDINITDTDITITNSDTRITGAPVEKAVNPAVNRHSTSTPSAASSRTTSAAAASGATTAAASGATTAAASGATTAAASGATASAAAPEAQRTLRVDFDKLDTLLNLVGELVLAKARLHGSIASVAVLGRELDGLVRRARLARGKLDIDDLDRFQRILAELANDLGAGGSGLDHVSTELRQQVMKLRMLPIGRVLTKYHRTVRELAHTLGKKAKLELVGADTELDKILLEQLDDPLLHLVRNAIDHGIELPAERRAAGKPEEGTLTLTARHRGNQIIVEASDDGAGIDPDRLRKKALEKSLAGADEVAAMDDREVLDLIFRPGFSTAARVTDVSGRGVGMDVVRDTITKLQGTIDLASEKGAGTRFTLKLPLTLAIVQVLLVRVAGEDYALPLDVVMRTLAVKPENLHRVHERDVLFVGEEQIPVVWTGDALELESGARLPLEVDGTSEVPIVLVDCAGQTYGLAVEKLLGKREIVLKSLGALLAEVPCAAGATLLGDRVSVILDVVQIVQRALARAAPQRVTSAPTPVQLGHGRRPRILVAEDSEVVRESLRRVLESHGYEVVTARDGAEALDLATRDQRGFDLVSTDVMMPNLDGYELTRALRATTRHKDVPLIMVTSKQAELDRVRGFDAGVDEYLTKPLDGGELLRAVERHLQRRA